jgi:hypothetical protein
MKDAKKILNCAAACGEAMIVDRILVRVLPTLIENDLMWTVEDIRASDRLMVSDGLYAYIHQVAEDLVGAKLLGGADA